MLTCRLAIAGRMPLTTFVTGIGRSAGKAVNHPPFSTRVRLYAAETRTGFRRAKAQSLKEAVTAPAGESAFTIGKGLVAGAAAVGLGSLCYYGLGLSNEVGAIDRSAVWSADVRKRIHATYMYFGGSIALTAVSALGVFRSPVLLNMMMKNSWLAIGATFAAMIGTGMIVRSIPYREGFGLKQLAWAGHCAVMGAVVAPLCLLGGPILVRAAWYTAGVVGGLTTLAVCAPSEKFLTMGAPLSIGLGVVLVSSIGSMFLPPTSALGAGLYSITLYGGLVLFSLFLLYDTQRIIHKAENHPPYAMQPYDPVNASIGIYLDTLNIFIRIATILAGGGNRKR